MFEYVFVLLPVFALGLLSLVIGGSIALLVFARRRGGSLKVSTPEESPPAVDPWRRGAICPLSARV
jgi:hypothetical protein